MATILDGAPFALSDAAAERMVDNGLIQLCENDHVDFADSDRPIYHRACDAPAWFGFATMAQAIRSAEEHAKLENNGDEKNGVTREE